MQSKVSVHSLLEGLVGYTVDQIAFKSSLFNLILSKFLIADQYYQSLCSMYAPLQNKV